MSTTAVFRLIGSLFSTFQGAAKVSGFLFSVIVTYAGYTIPVPSQKPWFSWLRYVVDALGLSTDPNGGGPTAHLPLGSDRWLDPIYYAFEGLMTNECESLLFDYMQLPLTLSLDSHWAVVRMCST